MIEQLDELEIDPWLNEMSCELFDISPLPMEKILKRCCYAPACGFDFEIVDVLAGNLNSFVFIDENYIDDEVLKHVKSKFADKYRIVANRFIGDSQELTKGRSPLPLTTMQLKRIPPEALKENNKIKRFARWLVLENGAGPAIKRISILIISADAVATYHYLFGAYRVAPIVISITESDNQRGEKKWSDFFNEEGFFAEFVLRSPSRDFPEFLIFGGHRRIEEYRQHSWQHSYGFELATVENEHQKSYIAYRRTEDKSLWSFRILQVLPFEEQYAITTKDIDKRLKKYFQLNLKQSQLLHQMRALEDTRLIIHSKESENQRSGSWYRNASIDLDLSNTDAEGVIGLSILDKIGEKLLPSARAGVYKLVEQQRRRLALITDNDNAERIANRFAYADFVPIQKLNLEVTKLINQALLTDCAITVLYRPRDEEHLIVDVGVPLGIVQKSSLQTLIIEIKDVRSNGYSTDNPSSRIIRIPLERIQKVHLNRYEGQIDCASKNINLEERSEFWLKSYAPSKVFSEYLVNNAGGMSNADADTSSKAVVRKKIRAHVHVHLKTHLESAPRFINQKFELLTSPPYLHDEIYDGKENTWYELTGVMEHTEEVFHWILSWAERIIVLEPFEVKANIERRITKTLSHYQSVT